MTHGAVLYPIHAVSLGDGLGVTVVRGGIMKLIFKSVIQPSGDIILASPVIWCYGHFHHN